MSSLYKRNKFSYLAISFNLGISSITSLATNYLFMNKFQAPPHILSYIQTFTAIPWYIKPIFGLITDLLPICGYRRKIYIIFMGLLQCLCLIMLKYICLNVYYAIVLFFLINMSLSFSSIISQAIFVELGQNHKQNEGEDDEKALNSLYTFYKYLGVFTASLFKGILVEKFSIENVFLIASIFPTIVIIAGFIFYEKRIIKKHVNTHKQSDKPFIVKQNSNQNTMCQQILIFFTQKKIIIIIFFILLLNSLPPTYESPLFYFNNDVSKFTPNNFAMIHLLSTLFSLVIIQLYKRCLSSLSFKTIITTGRFVVLSCIFIHYLIIQEYTVKYVDNYSLFLISGPIQFAAKEFSLLPVQVLAGSLCPKNLEGTVYAVFVSGISFGTAIGNLIGSYIMGKLKIGKGHYDNFSFFLKILIIMGFVPIVMLLFIKREMLDTKKKANNKIKDKKDIDLQKGQV